MTRPYILVVEDNAIMAKLVCRYLELQGFEARGLGDGIACIEHLAERTPDVILTDVMMPRMDGIMLTEHLKSNEATRAIPVLIVTALNDHDTQQRAIRAGAIDVIAKPIDEAVLIAKVRLLTDARRGAKQIEILRAAVDAFRTGDATAAEALLSILDDEA